jgi:hypothetical protein
LDGIMLSDPPRAATFWIVSEMPAAILTVIIAALIHPVVWLVTGLAVVVGESACAGELQRRSTDIPPPWRFIGS